MDGTGVQLKGNYVGDNSASFGQQNYSGLKNFRYEGIDLFFNWSGDGDNKDITVTFQEADSSNLVQSLSSNVKNALILVSFYGSTVNFTIQEETESYNSAVYNFYVTNLNVSVEAPGSADEKTLLTFSLSADLEKIIPEYKNKDVRIERFDFLPLNEAGEPVFESIEIEDGKIEYIVPFIDESGNHPTTGSWSGAIISGGLRNFITGEAGAVAGMDNYGMGQNSGTLGVRNFNNGVQSLLSGEHNILEGESNILGGEDNLISNQYIQANVWSYHTQGNIVGGGSNKLLRTPGVFVATQGDVRHRSVGNISYNILGGYNNQLSNNTMGLLVSGNSNKIFNAHDSIIAGQGNIIGNPDVSTNATLVEHCLITGSNNAVGQCSNSIIGGQYAGDGNAISFRMGAGTSGTDRRNLINIQTSQDFFNGGEKKCEIVSHFPISFGDTPIEFPLKVKINENKSKIATVTEVFNSGSSDGFRISGIEFNPNINHIPVFIYKIIMSLTLKTNNANPLSSGKVTFDNLNFYYYPGGGTPAGPTYNLTDIFNFNFGIFSLDLTFHLQHTNKGFYMNIIRNNGNLESLESFSAEIYYVPIFDNIIM